MNFTMMNIAASASLVLVAGDAWAGPTNYMVEARAITNGMPGSGAQYVGPLVGQLSASAVSDPAATQWTYFSKHLMFADAEAFTWTDIGALALRVQAIAQVLDATSYPTSVTANSYGRFSDRVLVASDTLAKNTPVTLTFRAAVSVDWEASGVYDAQVGCSVQVGVGSAYPQWSVSYDDEGAPPVVSSPEFVVKTTVGSTLSISGRLDSLVRASYWAAGQANGAIELDAECVTPLIAASGDVHLVAESGVDYAAL
jgi:hypothetical protein